MPKVSSAATMDEWHGKVAVVTVTYGKRWHYLEMVISRLLQDKLIGPIVVVDNAAEVKIAERIESIGLSQRVRVVDMGENSGSAKGYRTGISTALDDSTVEFIYLLDDDNLPQADALNILLSLYNAKGNLPSNAFLSLRPDRNEFVRAAQGLMEVRVRRNSFMGFHLLAIPEKLVRHIKLRTKPISTLRKYSKPICQVQYAPYGGMLVARGLIEKIGLPDENYFLYSDDHEYSSRIDMAGGAIWLCADSVVDDLEKSWYIDKRKVHPLFEQNSSLFRIYYSVRNRVNLERSRFVDSSLVYSLNMLCYLLPVFLMSVLRDGAPISRMKRVCFLGRCISDGWTGKLGKRPSRYS